MTNNFNVYDDIYTSTVQNYTTISEWFNQIKSSDYTEVILQARKFGKGYKIYTSLKATVPAITYNFNFKDKKLDSNITTPTGLLYIDIDDSSFDIESLDKNKIFSYYKSFGGNGYSVLVQVTGLTKNNFKDSYISICTELGIGNVIDTNAIKATQYNVLSFDPNIYINYNSFIFSSSVSNVIDNNSINNFVPLSSVIREKKETYTSDKGTKLYNNLRYDNLDEINIQGNYNVNWDGYKYVSCFLMMNKVTSNRNNVLIAYCNNLVWLNPHLIEKDTFEIMINVNKQVCKIPVDIGQIKSIVSSIFKYKMDGTLKPKYNDNLRKIVFDKKCKLNKEEKFYIVINELANKKIYDSKQKINDILVYWDYVKNGKITIRAVAKEGKMNKDTVTKYWYEFKTYVKSLNEANVESIKSKTIQPEALEVAIIEDKPVEAVINNDVSSGVTNDVILAAVQPCKTPDEQKAYDDYLEIMKYLKPTFHAESNYLGLLYQ